jgi:twitching motility two-component system response regulator PilH
MNKTILIVEDESAIRNVVADFLKKDNYSVLTAENGEEGVKEAISKHPDLILLDLLMPVMGGMDALREIRKDSWGASVPVIILTNLDQPKEYVVQNMIEDKPLYYLIKSNWKLSDVVEKIKEVLKIK